MNDDSRIYVEAVQPATLGAGKLTHCATLQEARLGLACAALSTEDTGDGQGDWRTSLYGTPDSSAALRAEAGVSAFFVFRNRRV